MNQRVGGGLINLQRPSECPHRHPVILIDTTDESRRLDNAMSLKVSFPTGRGGNIKPDSLQFAAYMKDE